MTIPILTDIINNFWFFQTDSVVPIFQEWSTVMILVLFAIPFVLAFVVDQAIHKSKYHVVIGLVSNFVVSPVKVQLVNLCTFAPP